MTPADLNPDFVDLLTELAAAKVDFVVVGAYALAAHGFPRATGDIDILVRPTIDNSRRVHRALAAFGAPVGGHGVGDQDFAQSGNVYQIGLPPRRIDILTSISGVTFDEALEGAIVSRLGAMEVRFIGKLAMMRNKRASGRPKDLVDADLLERGS